MDVMTIVAEVGFDVLSGLDGLIGGMPDGLAVFMENKFSVATAFAAKVGVALRQSRQVSPPFLEVDADGREHIIR
jgi:hypothetical protein